eukprot:4673025-Pleurochrysis_carterae.AAC.1
MTFQVVRAFAALSAVDSARRATTMISKHLCAKKEGMPSFRGGLQAAICVQICRWRDCAREVAAAH